MMQLSDSIPQVCSHFQCTNNIGSYDLAISIHKHIYTLNHVQENLKRNAFLRRIAL